MKFLVTAGAEQLSVRRYFHLLRQACRGVVPLRTRFDKIYRDAMWSGGGEESRSGAGSTLSATSVIRSELPALLDSIGAQSLLDVGCGDYNWMKKVELTQRYHGVDIVESVIQENQRKYAAPNVSFSCLNAVDEPLPLGFDVVLCREVLFHLSFRDSRQMLQSIFSSGAKYLLATSSTEVFVNADISSGGFRNLNLQETPFSFPKPVSYLRDDSISTGRILGMWDISDFRAL